MFMPELQGRLEDLTAGKAFLYLDDNYLFHFGPGKNLDYILFRSSGKVFAFVSHIYLRRNGKKYYSISDAMVDHTVT